MNIFACPAPQWTDISSTAVLLEREILFLDVDGYYRFYEQGALVPSAVIHDDGTGTLVIVPSAVDAKRITKNLTSNVIHIY